MLFQTSPAWNLVYDVIKSHDAVSNTYAEDRIHEGLKLGWINDTNQRRSREMFIFADRPIIPPEVDISIPTVLRRSGHLDWYSAIDPAFHFTNASQQPEHVRQLKPLILGALEAIHTPVEVSDFDHLLTVWERRLELDNVIHHSNDEPFGGGMLFLVHMLARSSNEEFERQTVGMSDSAKARLRSLVQRDAVQYKSEMTLLDNADKLSPLSTIIDREFSNSILGLEFAKRGIPIFGQLVKATVLDSSNVVRDKPEDYLELTRFYFENSIAVPSPDSFREAVKLRENHRIIEWRQKIHSWSDNLSSGKVSWKLIKEELDEANGYIDGSRYFSRLIPRWLAHAALPVTALAFLLPGGQLLHLAEGVAIGVECLYQFGTLVNASVTGPNPLKYQWLLVDTAHEGHSR